MCPQNVLFGFLPETVKVSGKEFKLNSGFRTWLAAGDIMKSEEADERKTAKLIKLCYESEFPENTAEAISGIMHFYTNAFPKYKSTGKSAAFSAAFDGQMLYSAFMKVYGIDLSREDIHWYRFAPLMYELSDCVFSRIMEFRSADISKIKKEMRAYYSKMKNRFSLPAGNSDKSFAESLAEIF